MESDVVGLGIILLGLVTYRLGDKCDVARWRRRAIPRLPWRRGKKTNPGISMTEEKFEWDAPVFRMGTSISSRRLSWGNHGCSLLFDEISLVYFLVGILCLVGSHYVL